MLLIVLGVLVAGISLAVPEASAEPASGTQNGPTAVDPGAAFDVTPVGGVAIIRPASSGWTVRVVDQRSSVFDVYDTPVVSRVGTSVSIPVEVPFHPVRAGEGGSASQAAGVAVTSGVLTCTPSAIPRSGPIPRSLGAASRAEQVARKLGMNVNSPTTRQVLNSLDDSVVDFVGAYRKGSIWRELPGEVADMSLEEALTHSTKVRKLLTDNRFLK